MKALLVYFCFCSPVLAAQTTLYLLNDDGSIDSNSYRHVVHATGLTISHDQGTGWRSDTAFNFRLIVYSDSMDGELNKVWHPKEKRELPPMRFNLGWLTIDKKIVDLAVPLNGERTPSAYVRKSKIYSLDHKLLAYIDGDEKYGVGLYLLHE